ncbi:MAG: hypothetical protein ABL876_09170 [Chitinophagaceae bacterium]
MRYLLIICVLIQCSCSPAADKDPVHKKVTGNWFVLYPKLESDNQRQEDVYAKLEDSLVTLKGVKLVSFLESGVFIQWDSTILKGKWGTVNENEVVVSRAGKGFENFKAVYSGMEDDVLKLAEYINANGEKLKLVWHLKKITSGKTAGLFDTEKNKWRAVPAKEETEEEMKQRLSQMLSYYSIYFKLISDESSYFMPVRIMLPVKFYQHAIGMKEYDTAHRFTSLFHSAPQAKKGFDLLKKAVNSTRYDLPDDIKNSYSYEYSLMLEKLSEEIKK